MSQTHSTLRRVRLALWMLTAVAASGAIALWVSRHWGPPPAPDALESTRALITGEFSLVDHGGKAVTKADYRGKWMLVSFGFTYCPDVCPLTLDAMSRVMDALGDDAERVVPLFISVDPERDKPEVMADYVAAFHPAVIGLTGSPEQVRDAAKNYRAYYKKVAMEGVADGYTMEHSAFVYLMNTEGDYQQHFAYSDPPEDITAGIRRHF